MVMIKKDGLLCTKTYRKSTATNTLLYAESHHPESLIKGIPIGQFLRIRRNCTFDDDFENQAVDLAQRLKNHGYDSNSIKRGYLRAKEKTRSALIYKPKNRDENTEAVGPFPRMTARRAPSLRDRLTNSHFVNSKQENAINWLPKCVKGMYKCGHCKCCKFIHKCSEFSHLQKNKNYTIHSFINCKTTAVVYLIECDCPLRYIGKTKRSLGTRLLEHVGDIRRKSQKSTVAKHFNTIHGLRMFGIENVTLGIRGGDIDKVLLQKELRWIYELDTKWPQGLNEDIKFGVFL
ncbi:hypothetical protein XELAEV_18029856mg [Xenopus laevis]|uniref:Helix-turn-helix domain-containing protein n=1 Tax=Xenopus laevis TaxID=8355 RepID=A0A974HIG4_XENLA|nr:hypothetical protein XELAEV_18029856mg [Xenopus laevis]